MPRPRRRSAAEGPARPGVAAALIGHGAFPRRRRSLVTVPPVLVLVLLLAYGLIGTEAALVGSFSDAAAGARPPCFVAPLSWGLRPASGRPWPSVGPLAAKNRKPKPSSRGRKKEGGGDDEDGGPSVDDGAMDGEAPRVSSQINIPVRRQIAFARQMKKLMKQEDRPAPPPPSKVRKKKKPGYQKAAVASDYPSFDPATCTTYLLVDGYNVINSWSKMIKARSVGGMPTARQALLEQLRYIYHARRWKVVVAYDEHTPGSELRVMEGDVDEVFTGAGESADAYIEKRARELCNARAGPTVKVATDDRAIQVVSLASGAEMMSTSSLIKEIYVARRELLYRRDGGDGYFARTRSFEDADEYFD